MDYQLKKDYDALLDEWVDLSDLDTLRLVTGLNEAGQQQLLVSLTDKLYTKIVEKVDSIDYGTIPKSAGDITRIENYESMVECLEIIRDIVKQYNQNQEPVDTVLTAITNIRNRRDLFNKCFAMNVELGQIMYNNMTMACVAAIGYMIAISIEFIKSPTDETFAVSLDKVAYQKTMNNMLYNDLRKFNIACKKGDVDKVLSAITGATAKKFSGVSGIAAVMIGTAVLIPLAKSLLPMIQDLVYLFFYSSQSISDYWATQADLLQMNRANLAYDKEMDPTSKDKILRKQDKAVDRMRKISNMFAVNLKTSEKNATNAKSSEERKYRAKKKTLDSIDTIGDLDTAIDATHGLF